MKLLDSSQSFESCRKRFSPTPFSLHYSFWSTNVCWCFLFHAKSWSFNYQFFRGSAFMGLNGTLMERIFGECRVEKVMILLPQLEDTWRSPFEALVAFSNQDFWKGCPLLYALLSGRERIGILMSCLLALPCLGKKHENHCGRVQLPHAWTTGRQSAVRF